jgi:riboflavin biosynthesis pyrimidine reductase
MLIFNVPDIRVVLLAGPEAAQHCASDLRTRPWVTTVPVEEPYGLSRAFEQLRAMGIARISCVGGRTLARELLDGTLVSDVYLTTSPKPGGEPGTPISDKPWRGRLVARKHCTGPESGVVFEHVLPR